jgi:hypothetical protein
VVASTASRFERSIALSCTRPHDLWLLTQVLEMRFYLLHGENSMSMAMAPTADWRFHSKTRLEPYFDGANDKYKFGKTIVRRRLC